MKYVKSLDGLRAVAVILVMLTHLGLVECGWIGVQIFFVLSGFLITGILLKDKDQPMGSYMQRFYWRRSLRIFPLYFLYIGLCLLAWKKYGEPQRLMDSLPYLSTYTYNIARCFGKIWGSPFFTHFWSLSVEEQFYLAWPLIIYLLPIRRLKVLLIGLIVAAPLLRLVLGFYFMAHGKTPASTALFLYFFTLTQIDAFAYGAIIPVFGLKDRIKNPQQMFLLASLFTIYAGVSNLLFYSGKLGSLTLGYIPENIQNFQHVWSYITINACSMFCIVYLLSVADSKLGQFLSSKWLVSTGKISYGIYVYHWGILAILTKFIFKGLVIGWAWFPAYFAVVYGVSYLSFNFFEKWFIELKDKYFVKAKESPAFKGNAGLFLTIPEA